MEKEMNVEESLKLNTKLIEIQNKLKAPKNQRNNFGGYNYRSCEDILEAVKPLLKDKKLVLRLTDELINVGDRYYIKATAILTNGLETIENTAYAREEETKKGMDGSQITGAASSYARKYALNGLFLIDDVNDSDKEENEEEKLNLMNELNHLVEEKGADFDKIHAYYKVNSTSEMTIDQLDNAIKALRKSKGE